MKNLYLSSLLVSLSVFGSSVIAADNLVKNGGAETGIDNWTGVTLVEQGAQQGVKAFKMAKNTASSQELMPVNNQKHYIISGWFKNNSSIPSRLLLGVIPFDKDRQQILPEEINAVAKTDTVLIAECNAEDNFIKVKDAAKWQVGKQFFIAFDTKNDYSDLPNRKLSLAGITKIEKMADGWKVQLKNFCARNFPAGTNVRLHQAGNTYLYPVIKTIKAKSKWTNFEQRINFMVGKGNICYTRNWWAGTAFVKIVIICNESKLLFDDIQFKKFKN